MARSIFALFLGFWISGACLAQASLAGTYKLVSFAQEIDGAAPVEVMGKTPTGYVVLTPTRWINLFGSEGRKFGTSTEEKAALYESMVAYSGTYRLDGNRLIVSVDTSWNERWNGTQVVRFWQLEGRRLTITTERAPAARDPSKMSVARVVFDKVE